MATRLSKAYLLTQVLTANKQEIVIYLYEGAISYIGQAIACLKTRNAAEANEAIERCVGIVIELSNSLNYSAGDGHLALRLEAIYNYLIETLGLAAARNDVESLEACMSILLVLHDAWRQAEASEGRPLGKAGGSQLQISA